MQSRAWVCLSGHSLTTGFMRPPSDHDGKFCRRCSERIVGHCQHCQTGIEPFVSSDEPPSFCHACGKPYPWLQGRLDAANELLGETELNEQERQEIIADVLDVAREAPRQEAAMARFRRLVQKAKLGDSLRSIFVSVLSEAAKRQMFGP